MKKLLLISSMCLLSVACTSENSVVCIDNVEYIKQVSGYWGYMSPHFKPDGSLYLCEVR